ncbi:MAG: hypothetical protein KBT08_05510 [Bacteroidales bacterium]|nr:hypothetical protein [Candidatus Cryptobacteroides onthequi]
MRKIQYFISAAVIALGLASCSKEETMPAERQISIVASTESAVDTKTSLSGDDQTGYQVLWSEGDKIHLNDGWNSEFTLKDGAGTARGTFEGRATDGDGDYKAYYAVTGMYMPDVTNYMGENVISSVPMVASVSIKDGVASVAEFKNMCGILRLTLNGSGDVKQIKIYATQRMYGNFTVADDCSMEIGKGSATQYISHYCGDGVALSGEGTDFYIPLPPNNYSGVKIEIIDCSGNICTKTLKSDKKINIGRSLITPVSLTVTGLEKKPDVPDGALYGVFTVKDPDGVMNSGDERKVYFSRGNLYWDGDSFEFETLQSDRQTVWNQHHVNHFYWSFWDEEASAKDYKVKELIGIFTNEEYDNSKARESFTVNGVTGKYRVLTYFELKYLFEHHSRKWVTVNGIPGYVVAPDGVELDSRNSYSNVELNTGDLVFLPVTGIRVEGNISYPEVGYYWTSSMDQNNEGGYMYLSHDGVDQGAILNWACCIRLVVDID